jgi:RNA polymerase sigma-70 factor (ECF subfamily)
VRDDKECLFDAYLAAAARAGDRRALSQLAERWQPKFLGHAWRLTGEADLAADMAQEAWIEIMRGIARLDDAAAFPAWAMRIVTRRCAKAIRRRQRRRAGDAALAREPGTGVQAPDRAEARADLAPLRRAMAGLPAAQRAALGLFYLEEMSVAEIAVALEVPPGTVKTRLMHARNKLRAELEGEGDEQD